MYLSVKLCKFRISINSSRKLSLGVSTIISIFLTYSVIFSSCFLYHIVTHYACDKAFIIIKRDLRNDRKESRRREDSNSRETLLRGDVINPKWSRNLQSPFHLGVSTSPNAADSRDLHNVLQIRFRASRLRGSLFADAVTPVAGNSFGEYYVNDGGTHARAHLTKTITRWIPLGRHLPEVYRHWRCRKQWGKWFKNWLPV